MKNYKSWDDLKKGGSQTLNNIIDEMKEKITLEEINYLLSCIAQLNNPEDILNLTNFQNQQETLGAWVQGFLPDQLLEKDLLQIPDNIEKSLLLINELVKQKEMNIQAINKLASYPLEFKHQHFIGKDKPYPKDWKLQLDIQPIKKLLYYMKKDIISYNEAYQLASIKSNQEMLKHRKNLAYLPGHKTTTEDLTQLILKAQSQNPIDLIWKWLNPMNDFDMADIYNHLNEYDELIESIEKKQDIIISEILGTIHEYIKLDLSVSETFGLTVGFGVRGWATETIAGANIEYLKDDYPLLLGIIGHEVFHRMQTLIFSNKNKKPNNFEEMVQRPFKNEKDNKLYEVLSYILLEGTGEIVKYDLMGGDDYFSTDKVEEGVHLINHIYDEIYLNNNLDKVDEYLNQGLISTGPFYSLGKVFADVLIKKYSKSIIGDMITQGTISFYKEVFAQDIANLNIKKALISKIRNL